MSSFKDTTRGDDTNGPSHLVREPDHQPIHESGELPASPTSSSTPMADTKLSNGMFISSASDPEIGANTENLDNDELVS